MHHQNVALHVKYVCMHIFVLLSNANQSNIWALLSTLHTVCHVCCFFPYSLSIFQCNDTVTSEIHYNDCPVVCDGGRQRVRQAVCVEMEREKEELL